MKTRCGFTLIELTIVVTIIAIVAAIALPSLLRSRIQAYETAAIQNLRTIHSAQTGFHTAKSRFGSFQDLKGVENGLSTSFLDQTWLEGGARQGYAFIMSEVDTGLFVCSAEPIEPGVTGVRYFRIDTSGIIRWNAAGPAAETDPALGSQAQQP